MSAKRSVIVMVALVGIFFVPILAGAQQSTTNSPVYLLAPLPGGTNQVTSFSQYAQQLYAFLLSAAAVLALVMLVIGGIQYLSAGGNTSRISDAKDRIQNALLGLLLAIASWLILNTINPALVKNDFGLRELPDGKAPTGAVGSGQVPIQPPPDDGGDDDEDVPTGPGPVPAPPGQDGYCIGTPDACTKKSCGSCGLDVTCVMAKPSSCS